MLRRPKWMAVLVLTLALATPLAWGSEEGEGEANLFGGDLAISICTLLVFAVVLVVLTKFAWGPMVTALQNREKFIRESLESARRDRQSAEARLKEYERKLEQARQEASGLVEEGRRDAEAVKRRIENEARTSANAVLGQAKREIGIARDTALRELHERSAELAMTMAHAVLERQLSPEDHQRLVRDALTQLQQRAVGGN